MQSLLEQVNILIKMKVGDPYRLEHIKLMLKQNELCMVLIERILIN